jgi:DNA-directed RNA polymerase sigma subunit (sigma70/sigma32)
MPVSPPIDRRAALLRDRRVALADAPMLSVGDELAAAAAMADGRSAEYELAGIDDNQVLDLAHTERLVHRAAEGERARRRLIASCGRLVVSLAHRHDVDAEGTEALLGAGDNALARAADRYDPTGGLPFSAFARWWVERAMAEVDQAHVPVDDTVLTALGRLHEDDCRVIELRLGLGGGPGLSGDDTARLLGLPASLEAEQEERALAKLRHPCTPGNLTYLRHL